MQDSICFYVVMVPMAGLEPASREAVDFESNYIKDTAKHK